MASIRKLPSGRHRCRVRVQGYPLISKSFHKAADARAWGFRVESDMQSGRWKVEGDPLSYQSNGFAFRTSFWNNANDTNAYIAAINNSNSFELGKGTNDAGSGYTQLANVPSVIANATTTRFFTRSAGQRSR